MPALSDRCEPKSSPLLRVKSCDVCAETLREVICIAPQFLAHQR